MQKNEQAKIDKEYKKDCCTKRSKKASVDLFPLAQHYSKVLLRQGCLFITKKGYLLKCKTFKSYTESLNDSLKKMEKSPFTLFVTLDQPWICLIYCHVIFNKVTCTLNLLLDSFYTFDRQALVYFYTFFFSFFLCQDQKGHLHKASL